MIRRWQLIVVLLMLLGAFGAVVASGYVSRNRAHAAAVPEPDAASLFNSQCAKCHGRDGRAKTTRGRQTHTRDFTGGEWQDDVSDERIFNSIRRGKGKMPAFKKLSDAEVDSLVSYVRRLRK